MAAGTVVSGGFPGRVAQEVQPNPKCNGCLHFDGQGGRIGICSIGSKPWLCGDGNAADIGYAPIARGAGTYLSAMSNTGAHAPAVGDQDTSSLFGAGSTRAVHFEQVSLGEEHVHFVKSMVAEHTAMQKQICRLCKSIGTTQGMAPANVGPQVCTCEPIEARSIAKALVGQLSNRERIALGTDEKEWLTEFVYACARSGFSPDVAKATSFHPHGKYETLPTSDGTGRQHVDFHPRGGGEKHRIGTFESRRAASEGARAHARRFASGTGADNAHPKTTHTPPGLPSMKEAVSVAKKGEETDDDIDKGLSWKVLDSGQPRAEASHGTYRIQTSGDKHVASYRPKSGDSFKTIGRGSSHQEAKQLVSAHHGSTGGTRSRELRRSEQVEKAIGSAITRVGSQYRLTGPDGVHLHFKNKGAAKAHASAHIAHYGEVKHIKDPKEADAYHSHALAHFQQSRGISKSFKLNFKPHPEGGSHIAHGEHGEYEISAGPKRNGHSTHRVDYYKHGAGAHPTATWHLGTREHAEQHANDHHMAVMNTGQDGA